MRRSLPHPTAAIRHRRRSGGDTENRKHLHVTSRTVENARPPPPIATAPGHVEHSSLRGFAGWLWQSICGAGEYVRGTHKESRWWLAPRGAGLIHWATACVAGRGCGGWSLRNLISPLATCTDFVCRHTVAEEHNTLPSTKCASHYAIMASAVPRARPWPPSPFGSPSRAWSHASRWQGAVMVTATRSLRLLHQHRNHPAISRRWMTIPARLWRAELGGRFKVV